VKRAVAAVVAVLALATGCSGSSAPPNKPPAGHPTTQSPLPKGHGLGRYYRQHLAWSSCRDGFECARLVVPLDYAKPSGRSIRLGVVRLPASGKRIGALVLNPGGPGAPGIDYARHALSVVPAGVRARFDVVGFDPRGVGESAPIRCVSGAFLDNYNALDPTDPGPQRTAFVRASKLFAHNCLVRNGAVALSADATINTARDMDVLRAALGDKKLSYVGKSYGTFIGALYAHLFPTHVRALILDGPVDPAESQESLSRVQGRGFEIALKAFLEDCARQDCALGSSYAAAESRLDSIIANAARHPLSADRDPSADGRRVNRAIVELGIAAALYNKASGWPTLREALTLALSGDGSLLLALADSLWERRADGTYPNLEEAFVAISCVDRASPLKISRYVHDARVWSEESPHFGAFEAWGTLACAFWPVPPVTRAAPLHAPDAPPLLVIGTTRDPATPYVDAKALARQLPGVLLTYDGDGHTVWGSGESPCVDAIGDAYLVSLSVPQPGTRC
jgi:pimeloyl-ACP methyl ester carboxylesterase